MSEETFGSIFRQLKGLKWSLIVAIVMGIVGAAVAWTMTKRDVSDLQRDVSEIKQDRADVKKEWATWRETMNERQARMEATQAQVLTTLERIWDEIRSRK